MTDISVRAVVTHQGHKSTEYPRSGPGLADINPRDAAAAEGISLPRFPSFSLWFCTLTLMSMGPNSRLSMRVIPRPRLGLTVALILRGKVLRAKARPEAGRERRHNERELKAIGTNFHV